MKSLKHTKIGRVLRDFWKPDGGTENRDDHVGSIHDLLASGAGEEQVVAHILCIERDHLALPPREPAALIPLARALLKLGVRPRSSWRRRKLGSAGCSACRKDAGFSHGCPCGFRICQGCLDENSWGMTCNGITWECPDCGRFRSF